MNSKKVRFLSRCLATYLVLFFSCLPGLSGAQIPSNAPITKDQSAITPQGTGLKSNVPSLDRSGNGNTSGIRSSSGSSNPLTPKIKIHVLGEVNNPGVYTLSVSDRLSDALALSAPKRISVRLVHIRNPQEKTKVYDLYRYFYFGSLENNPYLRDNDVVFVPPHKGVIRIEGPISRPGVYELANEKSVADVLALTGGVTSGISKKRAYKIIRFDDNGKKDVLDIENNPRALRSFKIRIGDVVVVPDIINDPEKFDYSIESMPGENIFYPTSTPNVFVLGQVTQGGSYPYKSHLRVKDYVAYASPTPQAKLNQVKLIRNGVTQKMNFDERPQPGDILVVKTRVSTAAIIAGVSTAMSIVLTALLLESTLSDRF